LPSPYRASVNSLVPIPIAPTGLPEFKKGQHVYALYPGTTTFYKAEMAGMKTREMCRLRFEGEEERDKEMEVERRYVLDTNQVK
jgi:SAGA-associated factor 29